MTSLILIGVNAVLLYFCWFCKDKEVIIYCIFTLIFNVISLTIPDRFGLLYYGGAAVTDLLIIIVLNKYFSSTKMLVLIIVICKWFIFVNLIGWILYMIYQPPLIYSLLSIALYAYAILVIILKGDFSDDRSTTLGGRRTGFFGNNISRSDRMQRSEEENET